MMSDGDGGGGEPRDEGWRPAAAGGAEGGEGALAGLVGGARRRLPVRLAPRQPGQRREPLFPERLVRILRVHPPPSSPVARPSSIARAYSGKSGSRSTLASTRAVTLASRRFAVASDTPSASATSVSSIPSMCRSTNVSRPASSSWSRMA